MFICMKPVYTLKYQTYIQIYMYVYIYIYIYIYIMHIHMYKANTHIKNIKHTHTHTHIYIRTHIIYLCTCIHTSAITFITCTANSPTATALSSIPCGNHVLLTLVRACMYMHTLCIHTHFARV